MSFPLQAIGFGEPHPLARPSNSAWRESCPMLSPDGRYIFPSRRYGDTWGTTTCGDVFCVEARVIERLPRRRVALAPPAPIETVRRLDPLAQHSQELWKPTLRGEGFVATPMVATDFEALFAAASDPGIWAMHPVRDRHQRKPFEIFFRTGMESRGALVFRDPDSGEVLGGSRFCGHDPKLRSVEIGYTFLVRSRWGSGLNDRIKQSMLDHAFGHVDLVEFVIGVHNLRSQRAVEKLGATLLRTVSERKPEGDLRESLVYGLHKEIWRAR